MVPRAGVENPHEMELSAINWGRIGGALLSTSYSRRSPAGGIFACRHGKAREKKPTTHPSPGAQAPSPPGMCAACCPMQKHCTPPCGPRQLVAGHPPAPGGRLRAGGIKRSNTKQSYFFLLEMYSFSNRRTHFGPPSSSQASRWACVSGRQDTGAGLGGAGGRPAPSRLPPLMLLETESCGHTVRGTVQRTPGPL